MEENKEEKKEYEELITLIKDEYEKKIADLKKENEEKIKKAVEEQKEKDNEEKIKEIRALISGRAEDIKSTEKEEKEEVSFFDSAVKETLDILKGGK